VLFILVFVHGNLGYPLTSLGTFSYCSSCFIINWSFVIRFDSALVVADFLPEKKQGKPPLLVFIKKKKKKSLKKKEGKTPAKPERGKNKKKN